MVPVIAGEPDRGAALFEQPVITGNPDELVSNLLIHLWLELPEFRAVPQRHYQIARFAIYTHVLRSLEDHLNLFGISARRNREVVFQGSTVGVEDEVDAFVDIRNFYLAVLGNVFD